MHKVIVVFGTVQDAPTFKTTLINRMSLVYDNSIKVSALNFLSPFWLSSVNKNSDLICVNDVNSEVILNFVLAELTKDIMTIQRKNENSLYIQVPDVMIETSVSFKQILNLPKALKDRCKFICIEDIFKCEIIKF